MVQLWMFIIPFIVRSQSSKVFDEDVNIHLNFSGSKEGAKNRFQSSVQNRWGRTTAPECIEKGFNYLGNTLTEVKTATAEMCACSCKDHQRCGWFTWSPTDYSCRLKYSDRGRRRTWKELYSGSRDCCVKGPSPKSECYCGLANRGNRQNRIYGGNTSGRNEYPWMVRIHSVKKKSDGCGASLINSRWILSAGHCVLPKTDQLKTGYAILGDHDITDPTEGTEVKMDISEIILHPRYKLIKEELVPEYDIALLKMKKDIDFMKHPYIRPVCLPKDPLEDYVGWDSIITGWGFKFEDGFKIHPEKLQYLTGPVQSNQECSKTINWSLPVLPDSFLCVDHAGGQPCTYDSGSPLVTKSYGDDGVTPGQNYEQIGVVSFHDGSPCNSPGYMVYARVTKILGWIKEIVGTDHANCPRA